MELLQTDANCILAGLAGFIQLAGTANHLLLIATTFVCVMGKLFVAGVFVLMSGNELVAGILVVMPAASDAFELVVWASVELTGAF
jgi:hypothetical protein